MKKQSTCYFPEVPAVFGGGKGNQAAVIVGLAQVNVKLPRTLRGRGNIITTVRAGGGTSNAVGIAVK